MMSMFREKVKFLILRSLKYNIVDIDNWRAGHVDYSIGVSCSHVVQPSFDEKVSIYVTKFSKHVDEITTEHQWNKSFIQLM